MSDKNPSNVNAISSKSKSYVPESGSGGISVNCAEAAQELGCNKFSKEQVGANQNKTARQICESETGEECKQ